MRRAFLAGVVGMFLSNCGGGGEEGQNPDVPTPLIDRLIAADDGLWLEDIAVNGFLSGCVNADCRDVVAKQFERDANGVVTSTDYIYLVKIGDGPVLTDGNGDPLEGYAYQDHDGIMDAGISYNVTVVEVEGYAPSERILLRREFVDATGPSGDFWDGEKDGAVDEMVVSVTSDPDVLVRWDILADFTAEAWPGYLVDIDAGPPGGSRFTPCAPADRLFADADGPGICPHSCVVNSFDIDTADDLVPLCGTLVDGFPTVTDK
jgi:hypothetical protein